MLLALAATTLVALALLSDLIVPRLEDAWARFRAHRQRAPTLLFDPGRERRAEQRARELLRSCVNEEEWSMYRDLGFLRVWGSQNDGPDSVVATGGAPYAYLIYPHKPSSPIWLRPTGCSANTAWSFPTRRGPTAAPGSRTPMTCWPNGWP